jgi:hypothetical protein
MSGFSLLAAGFNGIEAGSEDDVDLQECGTQPCFTDAWLQQDR